MTAQEQQTAVEHLQNIRRDAAFALGQLGVQVLDGATEEGMLRSNLSEILEIVSETSRILGYHGPARGLPDHAAAVIAKLPRQ